MRKNIFERKRGRERGREREKSKKQRKIVGGNKID